MIRKLGAAGILVLAIGGCGGSGTTSAPAAASSQQDGIAVAQTFLRTWDRVKVPTDFILVEDFDLWMAGKASGDGGPAKPVPAATRKVAAHVVAAYAIGFDKGQKAPCCSREPLATYLRQHGVS